MEYDVQNSYRVSAMFETSNLLKKYRTEAKWRRPGRPYCRKSFVSASLGVELEGNDLVMPGNFRLGLNPHTLSVLRQSGIGVVSATLTPQGLGVVYRKEVPQLRTAGAMALDLNLENVTTFDTEGRSEVYDLSDVGRANELYRRITSRFRRHDLRVKTRLFRKYATLKSDRTSAILHRVSSEIVRKAKERKQAIVMEDLRRVREIFRRSSGSSAYYLAKMNMWPFAELQRQLEYKANWEGLRVVRIDPASTSNDCSRCRGGMLEDQRNDRMVNCKRCGLVIDRDLNAAENLLSRALRSGAL